MIPYSYNEARDVQVMTHITLKMPLAFPKYKLDAASWFLGTLGDIAGNGRIRLSNPWVSDALFAKLQLTEALEALATHHE